MSNRPSTNSYANEKPNRPVAANGTQKPSKRKPTDYGSEGVSDHDIFNLPSSDWQFLGALTALAAVVRLFRIYQPSSVVFDEVQYV
jgi:dolichyl-phosphate-mannose-protein mannosyltransferase